MAKTEIKSGKSPIRTNHKGLKQVVSDSDFIRKDTDQTDSNKVFEFIGLSGARFYNFTETDFISIIRRGLPNKVISYLRKRMQVTEDEMSTIFHVSKRTLQRRGPDKSLNPEETERVIELAKLYTKGEEVLGDMEIFKEWMDRKILTLGNRKPKEFLDTSLGINILLDELGRIEYGVYS